MSTGETDGPDPTDLFGGLSDEDSSKEEASLDTEENTASPEGGGAAGGFLGQVEAAGVAKPPTATDGKPSSGEPPSNTAGDDDDGKDPGAVGVGGVAPEAGDGAASSVADRLAREVGGDQAGLLPGALHCLHGGHGLATGQAGSAGRMAGAQRLGCRCSCWCSGCSHTAVPSQLAVLDVCYHRRSNGKCRAARPALWCWCWC